MCSRPRAGETITTDQTGFSEDDGPYIIADTSILLKYTNIVFVCMCKATYKKNYNNLRKNTN